MKSFLQWVRGANSEMVLSPAEKNAAGAPDAGPKEATTIEAASPLPKDLPALHELAASVWESHDDEEYRRDQSHWRGHGRWKDEQRWLKIGEQLIAGIRQVERLTGRDILGQKPVVLEWGPGGGSNLYALRSFARKLYATDVSQKNLEESGRVLAEAGFASFEPVLLSRSLEEDLTLVREPIDVFTSSAVFQHFPSKEYGLEVLAAVGRLLATGGVGRVQMRFDNGNPRYQPKAAHDYRRSHITATSYGLDEFWDALKNAGLEPLSIASINTKNNYATYLFAKGSVAA